MAVVLSRMLLAAALGGLLLLAGQFLILWPTSEGRTRCSAPSRPSRC
jgi:hypothetical protein